MQDFYGGLALENVEAEKLNKLKLFLQSLEVNKTVSEFKICRDCNGTGLYNVIYSANDPTITLWNGLYCKLCKGTGYVNIDEAIIVICPICKGDYKNQKGCDACNGVGYVDWLTNIKLNFGVL